MNKITVFFKSFFKSESENEIINRKCLERYVDKDKKSMIKCKHDWERPYDGNSAKRRCKKCNRCEIVVSRRSPSFTKPSLEWKFMCYLDEKK